MKNFRNKGFTLIELLAVIVILAIIALIATPKILDMIEEFRKNAFLNTGYGIVRAGEYYYSTKGDTLKGEYDLVNNNVIPYKKGDLRTGQLKYNDEGKISIAIWNGRYCVVKNYDEDRLIIVSNKDGENCKVDKIDKIVNAGGTGYLCSNPGSIVPTEEKYFVFDQTTKTITGYSNEGPKDLVIPCTIGGVNVENIGISAFASKQLTSVIMPDTVITISNYAFQNNSITKLELGNSVESIGYEAFGRNLLTEVTFPDSLKATAPNCSGHCTVFSNNPITKVTFGNGLETISEGLFASTSTLTTVNFSSLNKLREIRSSAFFGTNLTELNINTTNPLTISYNAFKNSKLVSITINSPAITIGAGAFQDNLLESINLLEKTVSIGNDAFKNNQMPDNEAFIYGRNSDGTANSTLVSYAGANRSNITIPDAVTDLSNATFNNLGLTGTLNTGNGLTSIESRKFENNTLANVIIGNSVTTIGESAFQTNNITNVVIGSSVTTIGGSAFKDNRITNLVISDSVITIGDSAFKNNQIVSLVIGNGVKTIYNYAFENNKINSLDLGNSVESIGYEAFSRNLLTEVTFPNSLKSIVPNCSGRCTAFSNNPITKVTFGNGIETITEGLFADISTLTTVNFSSLNQLRTIGREAFLGTNLTELNINTTNPLTISYNAFKNSKLVSITINSPATTIGVGAFQNNLLESINLLGKTVSIGNDAFKNNQMSDNEAFIYGRNNDGTTNSTLVSYAGANRNNITIPDNITDLSNASFDGLGLTGTLHTGNGLTSIESRKFQNNTLTNVTIGNSVTTIGESAFQNNTLTNVIIGNSVKTISTSAFQTNNITNVVMGDSVTTIGDSAFKDNRITNLVISDSVITIGDSAFKNNQIASLVIGNGVKTIYNYAFENNKINSLDLGNSVESIEYEAFSRNLLTEVTFPNSLKSIVPNCSGRCTAFSNNPITKVTFGNGIETITEGLFADISTLTTVNFSSLNQLRTIGREAFLGTNLTELNINTTNPLTISYNAFKNSKLVSITINSPATTIGVGAFQNNLLESINLLGKTVSIGNDAFKNNQMSDNEAFIYGRNNDGTTNSTLVSYAGANRNNITIPDNITDLSNASFDGLGLTGTLHTGNGLTTIPTEKFYNNQLTKIIIGTSVQVIDSRAFYANQITELELANSVEEIRKGAFAYNRLTELVIPDSVKIIDGNLLYQYDGAFSYNQLTRVVFGSGLETIGSYAFYGNSLVNIEIPTKVLTIGHYAFYYNSTLTQILVKGKVNASNFTTLGNGWSGNATVVYELASCYVYSGNTITDYYSVCSKNVEIPSSLGGQTITTIGPNAFANKGLTRVVIPSTITTIGNNAFVGNNIDPIIVMNKAGASDFTSLGTNWNDGSYVIYEKSPRTCLKITGDTFEKYYNEPVCPRDVTIPNIVKHISDNPFNGILLSSITVEDGTKFESLGTNWKGNVYKVNFLGSSIVSNCYQKDGSIITRYQPYCPETVTIPTVIDGVSITSIGNNAFKNSAVRNITIGPHIVSIGNNAFENNDIVTISLTEGLQSIGDYAFYKTGLLEITIPGSVTSIGSYAFANNSGLSEINIVGKQNETGFTSLGTNWNGTCTNIHYLGN